MKAPVRCGVGVGPDDESEPVDGDDLDRLAGGDGRLGACVPVSAVGEDLPGRAIAVRAATTRPTRTPSPVRSGRLWIAMARTRGRQNRGGRRRGGHEEPEFAARAKSVR